MINRLLPLILVVLISCGKGTPPSEKVQTMRIITAGGTITEVVNALGFGGQIIATDITSTFPIAMKELPSIGYRNQIKAEGILALGPDLVLVEEDYLNPEVVEQLRAAQVKIQLFKKPTSVNGTKNLVTELATFFDKNEKGIEINAAIDSDLVALDAFLQTQGSQPSALFVMARGPQTVFVAGDKTFASEMFRIAKLEGTATGFDEFAPLTPESLVQMNPDYLVFFESGVQSLGGKEGLAKIQGIDQTNAFKKDQIIVLDGQYLSGFGPRVGKAALDLAKAARQ